MVNVKFDQDYRLTALKQPDINALTQVQPHGVLLVLKEADLTVVQVSQNTREAFGLSVDEVLGKTLVL